MVTERSVLDALQVVKDPDSQRDIVSLGMVRDVVIADGQVSFTLAFTNQPPAAKALLHGAASRAVAQVPGVAKVNARMGSAGAPGRPGPGAQPHAHGPQGGGAHAHGPQGAHAAAPAADLIPDVRYTIAVSSGKGGVGKSTVAVNLAAGLRDAGSVGVVDTDVYGPDVPLMLGTKGRPGMVEHR